MAYVDINILFNIFQLSRYLEPILGKTGDFPEIMKERIAFRSEKGSYGKSRLPSFTDEEIAYVKGSADFVGMNHYTTFLISDVEEESFEKTHYDNDMKAKFLLDPNYEGAKSVWLKVS